MLNSLMYRLSYYRFDEVRTSWGKAPGFDTVRQTEIGLKGYKLKNYEEVFTSENWIVRIFKVKPRNPRDYIIVRSKHLLNFPAKLEEIKEKNEIFNGHKYRTKVNAIKKKRIATL